MATKKKMLQAAAGNATGGAGLDITDVFSTYLYTGNGSTQTITNDIDLAGEGGLVWTKVRTAAGNSILVDSERGDDTYLSTESTAAQGTLASIRNFSSTGYEVTGTSTSFNASGQDYASWTFRKAPKFFDVVTWVGDGTSSRQIPHNLGAKPGAIFVKVYSHSQDWSVYHRELEATGYYNQPENIELQLNTTGAAAYDLTAWAGTEPTDTHFTVGTQNNNGYPLSYVAYLFAHNDGDGEFGPDGDQDIIKCGSYTGNGSTDGPEIDLGFEPQWLLIKNASGVSNWLMVDNMRGFPVGSDNGRLFSNLTNAEVSFNGVDPTATGFKLVNSTGGYNTSGNNYIYIAIRRGPLAPPESGTEVFDIDTESSTQPQFTSGFPVDTALRYYIPGGLNWELTSRLTQGRRLIVNQTSGEGSESAYQFDYMDGWEDTISSNSSRYSWMWKRAPNFFDVVAYTGDGVAGRTVSHNLGVAPEMMWVKERANTNHWAVYHKGLNGGVDPEDYYVRLNLTNAAASSASYWNNTAPTDTVFTVAGATVVNRSGGTFIAYLFATLAGVSKCGSYTGNGSSQTIDCGFTSGARFILIKRTDSTGDWYVWDTERGIVAGNDPHLSLNTTAAEVTSDDSIDPDNSGFIVNQVSATNINVSSASYIYYAIA